MIDPRKIGQFLMGEWDKTSQPLKERLGLLPLGQYEDGSVRLAWPGLLAAPAEGVKNFGQYGYGEDAVPYNTRMAFDAAGGAMTGGLATGVAGGLADNAVGSAGARTAKGTRPEPGALIPKTEAMGADAAPQGVSSGSIAETADDAYKGFIQALQEDPKSNPTIGPASPGVSPAAVRAAYEDRVRRWHSENRLYNREVDPYGQLDGPLGEDLPTVMDALSFAALAAGRKLESQGRSGSQYAYLETPTGDQWKVRVADHGNMSQHHGEADFNIAPGQMTVDEFIDLLPTIYSNAPTGSSVPLAVNALERAQPQGIRAYHGSPHDFDRFSLDKIGTGEGAQAYGHGLYFAESEDVARSYRDNLGGKDVRAYGEEIPFRLGSIPEDTLSMELHRTGDIDSAIKALEFAKGQYGFIPPEEFDAVIARAQQMKADNAVEAKPKGRMYEVNIRANPEDFLDWDKPLSDQNERVRALVERASPKVRNAPEYMPVAGGELYEDLVTSTPGKWSTDRQAAVTSLLREAGIPGIRYLDGMSRGAGEGSSNYVVFDDALIDILRKYANAPTGAAIPMSLEAQGQDTDPALLEYLRAVGLY